MELGLGLGNPEHERTRRRLVTDEKRPPEDFRDLGHYGPGMSNFDHSVVPGTETLLKAEKVFGHHAARDFNGDIWFEDGMFHESVYRFHRFVAHYSASTLQELMIEANNGHGWG